jgi:hypothetical protein
MDDHPLSPLQSDALHIPRSWCGHCQRGYLTGTYRLIWFASNPLNPRPATLKLCPFADCDGNTARHSWQWSTIRLQHPEYPVIPERNVIYVR